MRHFAKLDSNNIVEKVLVAPDVFDRNAALALFPGTWIETFKDRSVRKNYAGVGHTYDATRDAFIPPQPYPSWVLNETTCQWEAPIAYPEGMGVYRWNEQANSWEEV
jgi:hypothetical protein